MLPIVVFATGGCERRPVSSASESSPILVMVNDAALTEREFTYFLPEDYSDALTTDEMQEYLDRWITTQLLYDEGMRSGVVNESDINARIEQYRKDLVADELVQTVIQDRALVSDDEVLAYYQSHEKEYVTEYRVSHILVNTLEDAETVKEQLGTHSFTYLARKYSIDKHSGAGGDLGYLSKGNMIPEFEDRVFNMKLGEVSDIIETDFGYHIIKVVDIRDARFKLQFDDVKNEIANNLMLERREAVYDSLVTALKSHADIRVMDRAFAFGAVVPDTIAGRPQW